MTRQDEVLAFGVTAGGERLTSTVEQLAQCLRKRRSVDSTRAAAGEALRGRSSAFPPERSPECLDQVGWGVVWGASVASEIKAALAPLLELRRRDATDASGKSWWFELAVQGGEDVYTFLQRHGVGMGDVDLEKVPHYLLIVADPREVPFSFQSLLDVGYRVGRLWFAEVADFARYAASVVACEEGSAPPRERTLHAFGPTHPGDEPTALSCELLISAAPRWLDRYPDIRDNLGLRAVVDAGAAATKERLLATVQGRQSRPELLLTAGHGLCLTPGDRLQADNQGALVTAGWPGCGEVGAMHRFAAADVPPDADVHGLVAFFFACYGGGTPVEDIFPTASRELANEAFVAGLPQALLAHPRGSALGIFAHVARTLSWGLRPPSGEGPPVNTTAPFEQAMRRVLMGYRIGGALDPLNARGAALASQLAALLDPQRAAITDRQLVTIWTQQRDAESFILLGDPAARLVRRDH
jgi:hypothetical protein